MSAADDELDLRAYGQESTSEPNGRLLEYWPINATHCFGELTDLADNGYISIPQIVCP